ncbi:MAG TPA: hypothetical protein QF644_04600 [Candidatus Poseidoniaceae archaeon]|jgi:hypothetical protein|nr:hypothetical protein [Candidatus Poseidoniaceae archaeon]
MGMCAVDDCNGPTLPNSEYCLMHRKLNKEVVNQEQQTSSGGFGLVVLFFISLIILGWLVRILYFFPYEAGLSGGGGPDLEGCFGFMFGVIIVTFVFLLPYMDKKTKDN